MSTLIKVTLEVTPRQLHAISLVLTEKVGSVREIAELEEPEPEKPETKAEKPKKKPKETKPKAEEKEEKPSVTLNDIRKIMPDKIETSRDAVADKLKAFGAKNITVLDESKYEEFMEFLQSL